MTPERPWSCSDLNRHLDLDLDNVDIVGTRLIRSFSLMLLALKRWIQQATGFDLYVRDQTSDQVTLYIPQPGTLEGNPFRRRSRCR